MIALPLRVASLYHQFNGLVMPHQILNAVEHHLASPDTSLDNGDDWGLVQKWLPVAAQKDGGGGDTAKSKPYVAFRTDALFSNDDLIHRWITDKLDSTLGRRPEPISTTVGIQGNMAVVQNMFGIIATEVGRGLGVAMQNATISSDKKQAGGTTGSEEAKPYNQDQVATLLGFHGAKNVKYLMKMWCLFKTTKMPNYAHLRWALKGEMLRWADKQRCWIEEGVYFDNKSLDEWIALSSIRATVPPSTLPLTKASPSSSVGHPPLPTSRTCGDMRRFGMPPRAMQLTLRLSSRLRARA
jgi:hypothetical protein